MENDLSDKKMGVGIAILIGHLVTTLPVFVFICGLAFLGFFVVLSLFPSNLVLVFGFLLLGFIMAWAWWSLLIPRWRNWALKKGIPPDELQKWAARTGLVWRKGVIFEKTEYKWDEDKIE